MFGSETVLYLWYMWVDFVGKLGLPWDKQTTAYFGLAFVFYAIGLAFKLLVSKEK